MSIETPEHWSGETRRFAELLMREGTSHQDVRPGVLAIAVELAELRKTLTPTELTAVLGQTQPSWSPNWGMQNSPRQIVDAPDRSDVSEPELVQTLDSFEDQRTPEQLAMEAREDLDQGRAGLRFVGWYCPGGHKITDVVRSHGGEAFAEPNVRLEDPCMYSVPMYVLVQEHSSNSSRVDPEVMRRASPDARWQQRMMTEQPDLCWVFTAPATVCVAQAPCPRH